ncbi:hypothetical protein HK104_002162 [Borealophlyctis nickersoniae]|nr:hypothetical protein HK104_002162 [Borealophlyctis nickersoniae]
MDAIGKAAFGKSFQALQNPATPISKTHTLVKSGIFRPLYLFFPILDALPIPSRQRVRRNIDRMEQVVITAARETQGTESGDRTTIVERLVDAFDRGDMTRKEFRDNLMVIFVAGHENIQQGFTSLLYLLAKHPEIQEKARAEILATPFPSLCSLSSTTHLPNYPYLLQVIKETLRMYPPIPMLVNRRTTAPTILGEFVIPPNTYVGWHAFGTHHNTSAWNDPEHFDPGRFEKDVGSGSGVGRFEWVPFSEGPRKCLGIKLAMAELQTVVAALLSRYSWELPREGPEVRMTPGGLLGPRGLNLVFKKLA